MEKAIKLLICNSKYSGGYKLKEMSKVLPLLSHIFEENEGEIVIKDNEYWNYDNCNNRFMLIRDILNVNKFDKTDMFYKILLEKDKANLYNIDKPTLVDKLKKIVSKK